MTLTTRQALPATFVFLTLLTWRGPAYASPAEAPPAHRRTLHAARLSVRQRLDLYSPRVRRATLTYLRLRLLELREQDLDRARLAIERRLSIDELVAPPRRAAPATAGP